MIPPVIKKVIDILFSKHMLVGLSWAWVVYYVSAAIWTKEAFGLYIQNLGSNIVLQVPFVLFMLVATGNFVRSFLVRMKVSVLRSVAWAVLPLGLMIVMVGFFLSTTFSQTGSLVLVEGAPVKPPWQQQTFTIKKIIPGLKEEMLDITAGSGIFQYEPKVIVDTGQGTKIVGAFPPTNVDGTYYHILDFGLSPEAWLYKEGKLMRRGFIVQRILPPGAEDSFEIYPLPLKFLLRLAPERLVEVDGVRSKVYNLKKPLYNLTVQRGEDVLFDGLTQDDVSFEGYSLKFTQPSYWVRIEARSGLGLPFIYFGIGLGSLGVLLWMFLFALKLFEIKRAG